jgi:hypothetical protein
MSTTKIALCVAVLLSVAGGSVAVVAAATAGLTSVTRAAGSGPDALMTGRVSNPVSAGNQNPVSTIDGSARPRPQPLTVPALNAHLGLRAPTVASQPAAAPISSPCVRAGEPAPMCAVAYP